MVRRRDICRTSCVYAAGGSAGNRSRYGWGILQMQSTQPRDLGALILVIGLFLVLFVVTLVLGSPVR